MPPSSLYIPMEKLPSIQDLIGGVPRGTILGALGAPGAGKSTLFMQACAEVARFDKGSIIIMDTENKFAVFFHLCAGLSEAYGMNLNPVRVKCVVKKGGTKTEPTFDTTFEFEDEVNPKATNVFIIHQPDLTPISIMLGRGFRLHIYESGKFKVSMLAGAWVGDVEDIPIVKFMVKNKCRALLFDSVTQPFDEIPAVSENFPARTDATQILMIQLHKIAAHLDIPIMATFHESKNDTSPFNKQLKIEGGKAVGYNLAYTLYLLLQNEIGLLPKGAAKPKTLPRDERAVYVARAPARQPWANVRYFTITENGLVTGDEDGSEKEQEELVA